MTISIDALLVADTVASILNRGLDLAQAIGLPVTSWRVDDPTRALYEFLADNLAALEQKRIGYTESAFLSRATGDWLPIVSSEIYGVTPVDATASAPTVTITNGGGGVFSPDPGDWTFKASATGATFHNTGITAGAFPLGPGGTVTLSLVCDQAGSVGTVALNEVNTIVTTLLGLSITGSTAAIGLDAQSETDVKTACNNTLGALSPDGPPDAYEFVVTSKEKTGITTITRARSSGDSATGLVTIYVAGPDGGVDGASVTAAQNAVEKWATPLCITPTVITASSDTIAVTATISGGDVPADFLARITLALGAYFAGLRIAPIGGSTVDRFLLAAEIPKALPGVTLSGMTMSAPAANVAYAAGHVPKLGVVTITVV